MAYEEGKGEEPIGGKATRDSQGGEKCGERRSRPGKKEACSRKDESDQTEIVQKGRRIYEDYEEGQERQEEDRRVS